MRVHPLLIVVLLLVLLVQDADGKQKEKKKKKPKTYPPVPGNFANDPFCDGPDKSPENCCKTPPFEWGVEILTPKNYSCIQGNVPMSWRAVPLTKDMTKPKSPAMQASIGFPVKPDGKVVAGTSPSVLCVGTGEEVEILYPIKSWLKDIPNSLDGTFQVGLRDLVQGEELGSTVLALSPLFHISLTPCASPFWDGTFETGKGDDNKGDGSKKGKGGGKGH